MKIVNRAAKGSGTSRIASVSDWNWRTVASDACSGDKARSPEVRLVARSRDQMIVLLMPERTVDVISFQ